IDRRGRSSQTRTVGEGPPPPAEARPKGRWRRRRGLSRRRLLWAGAAAGSLLPSQWSVALARTAPGGGRFVSRVRPGDPEWPSAARWDGLRQAVGGRLVEVQSPLAQCVGAAPGPDCARLFDQLTNPYYVGDEVGLTQTLGWVDAWTSRPSAYAVAAETTADVV